MTQAPRLLQPKFLHPRHWPTWLVYLCLRLLALTPPRIHMTIGRAIGWLMSRAGNKRRRIASTNLRHCFPEFDESQHQALLRDTFAHLGAMFVDLGISWFASPAKLKNMAVIEGLEHIERALKKDKGVMLLVAHQTAMELGGQMLAQALAERGHPLIVMYKKSRGELMETLVQRGRYRFTKNIIHHSDMRGLLRGLKKGSPVWYAPDQDFGPRRSIFTTFFDIPAASIPMTHKLAHASGAALIPCNMYRDESSGHIRIELGPEVQGFPSSDPVADAQRVNDLQETIIRRHPAQYFWVHRRFKTQPPGEPTFYA